MEWKEKIGMEWQYGMEDLMYAEPDLPIDYIGLSLGPQDPTGLQQTVVHIESVAGI